MISRFFKLLISSILFTYIVFAPVIAQGQVCFTDKEAVDLITLLEASNHDIEALKTCDALVDQLYNEIKLRDEHIVKLTEQLIRTEQNLKDVERKREREKWLRYAGIGAIVAVIAKIAIAF